MDRNNYVLFLKKTSIISLRKRLYFSVGSLSCFNLFTSL